MNDATTLTCICGTDHTFPAGVATGTCSGCGLGLVLSEEVTAYDDGRDGYEDAVCDTATEDDGEPADIDDDRFTDPYTGGFDDMGYDDGRFDE